MKTFRRHSAARKAANGRPFFRVGRGKDGIFLVPDGDLIDIKLTEIDIISPQGQVTGHISMGHLDRLGNGNHAEPKKGWTISQTSFPEEA